MAAPARLAGVGVFVLGGLALFALGLLGGRIWVIVPALAPRIRTTAPGCSPVTFVNSV